MFLNFSSFDTINVKNEFAIDVNLQCNVAKMQLNLTS